MAEEQPFSITLTVRDYECDLQGIVNNSVYQNYMEHARHEFLKAKGIDFAALTQEGIHLVVIRAELDYKSSLTSGDSFTVSVALQRESKIKWAFQQEVRRLADNKLMVRGKIIGTSLNQAGRPFVYEGLDVMYSG